MQLVRFRRRTVLALIVAYVVAFQGIGAAFAPSPASFDPGSVAQLCRILAGSGDAPVGDHDGDRCKIVCASGACAPSLSFDRSDESANAAFFSKPLTRAGAHRIVGIGYETFVPFARGPPSSSV